MITIKEVVGIMKLPLHSYEYVKNKVSCDHPAYLTQSMRKDKSCHWNLFAELSHKDQQKWVIWDDDDINDNGKNNEYMNNANEK